MYEIIPYTHFCWDKAPFGKRKLENSLSHTKRDCKYQSVFAPKFRRKVAYGQIKQDIAKILSMLCKRNGVNIVEVETCPDHVHMLVEILTNVCVSSFVVYGIMLIQ